MERQVPRPSEKVTVSPVLEALILRLISDDRQERGTAEQLVSEAQRGEQQGGPVTAGPCPRNRCPDCGHRFRGRRGTTQGVERTAKVGFEVAERDYTSERGVGQMAQR